MALDLDPRFTFDAFVVGPANRLAATAAREVADAPGTGHNPLFVYGGSGLGKTHLLTAIGHHVRSVHDLAVRFDTLERLMQDIAAAVEAGERDAWAGLLDEVAVLLLDDVQFLEGHRPLQDELIRAWDDHVARGGQVVLAGDRPPREIDGLDERLLSRLSSGLVVDVAPPDSETRLAIARRKAAERGQAFAPDVYRVLAGVAFPTVHQLLRALNRLLAVQEIEQRTVAPEDVMRLLGIAAAERGGDEPVELLSDISGTIDLGVPGAGSTFGEGDLTGEGAGDGAAPPIADGSASSAGTGGGPLDGRSTARESRGILSAEKVPWEWPYPRDWIEEALD